MNALSSYTKFTHGVNLAMRIINQISIKQKTYLLVSLSVMVALILSFVSNNGLNTIRDELNDLIFATKIERYTSRLILEEQNYRLNANGSIYNFNTANKSFEDAQLYVEKIYRIINEANDNQKTSLHQHSMHEIEDSIKTYRELYLNGIKLLIDLNMQAHVLENEGKNLTRQIQTYVESKRVEIKKDLKEVTIEKINNGSNIWQYTYVTRLHEKKYRLSPNKKVLELFMTDYAIMMNEWTRLKNLSDQTFEFKQLENFKTASEKYETAMLLWIDYNTQLLTDILPRMQQQSSDIIQTTITSAEKSVEDMSEKHQNISFTLLIVSASTIIIGLLFGASIVRSISSVVSSFQSGLLHFFQYLNQQQNTAKPITIHGNDEISVMAKVVNQNIEIVQEMFEKKTNYQQALLEWSKVDYQDNNTTIQKATELSAKALHVERVSIWLFNEDKTTLTCADLYISELKQHKTGATLAAADYPTYFKAISNGNIFIVNQAKTDVRTQEFLSSYIEPLNIYSILGVPIGQDNNVVGMICHDKIGEEKHWSTEELDFASSVVSAIALSLEIKKRHLIQRELKAQKEVLHHHAHHDSLTGLPNRFLFNDRLNQAIKQAQRSNSKIAVLFIDLDRFKSINDSMGHNIGDELLIQVAQRLKGVIRQTDTLARLGGDEFSVVLDQIHNNDDVVAVTQNLLSSMKQPFKLSTRTVYITLSVGASVYPDDGDSVKELLKNADAAMYQAKDDGRNTYQFYTLSMTEKAFERIAMETSFRNALTKEEFVIFYQPQVDAKTNKLIGMEALIRWQHPEMGLISPAKFLSFAHDTGLIIPLDLWTMKSAMQQTALWHQQNLSPGILSLNLSVLQLSKESFVDVVDQMLKETGCQPQWVELEITEDLMMKDPEKIINILKQLKALGISLAIDDFGTGYSSLSQLKRLPINKLKIDRSFIRDLPDDEEDVVISKSIIALAKNMGLNVIAEGVETKQQKDFLLENGCRYIQGYHFGRPMIAPEFENKLIANQKT